MWTYKMDREQIETSFQTKSTSWLLMPILQPRQPFPTRNFQVSCPNKPWKIRYCRTTTSKQRRWNHSNTLEDRPQRVIFLDLHSGIIRKFLMILTKLRGKIMKLWITNVALAVFKGKSHQLQLSGVLVVLEVANCQTSRVQDKLIMFLRSKKQRVDLDQDRGYAEI